MNRTKTERVMTKICLWPFRDLDLGLWPIRGYELKSQHFGIGFIWIGQKLSVLWPKHAFDLFLPLTWPFDLLEDRELKNEPLALLLYESDKNWACYNQNIFFYLFVTLIFDLSEDRELKSEPFGVAFIWIRRKLSMLCPKYVFDLFVPLTLTFDLSEDRELKSEYFGVGFIWIWQKLRMLWPKHIFDLFVTCPWPLTYQSIGNWKVNLLALVSYESDENWACYDQNMFLTFLWPWPLTYQRIGNWKMNILALVSYESDENWAHYDQNKFLNFSWPWPLTWSLPKSNWLALGWWQIIPENFTQFGPVVFETFVTLTLTFELIAPKI